MMEIRWMNSDMLRLDVVDGLLVRKKKKVRMMKNEKSWSGAVAPATNLGSVSSLEEVEGNHPQDKIIVSLFKCSDKIWEGFR